jgi:hypothetical protein
MIDKIISGGQTGADRAGLEAARALGIATGGFAPRGFLTEAGPDSSLATFGLVETSSAGYRSRTRLNARHSDGTVWFGNLGSPGWMCTRRGCVDADKPFIENPTSEQLRTWITSHKVRILNVTGNRSKNLAVVELTKRILTEALRIL